METMEAQKIRWRQSRSHFRSFDIHPVDIHPVGQLQRNLF
jgi:hypothetical protein